MPEGHSVHRVARLFDELFSGSTVLASSPQGRFSDGAALLSGAQVERAEAKGKQLFMPFSTGQVLRVHLGIYGRWDVSTLHGASARAGSPSAESLGAPRSSRRRLGEGAGVVDPDEPFPPAPRGQVRLRLETQDVVADLRGPTACEVLTPEEADVVKKRLGPDPLIDRGVRGQREFVSRVAGTSRAIGAVLMDQSVVSGIGNVYRAEILFRHGLDPHRPASALDEETAVALWKDWAVLLKAGVKTGVMMTRDDLTPAEYRRALSRTSDRYFVYKREGQPCRACGESVALEMMATRKLYFCPACQTS
jgi:formamidopyrimidine-DNA glycosylase